MLELVRIAVEKLARTIHTHRHASDIVVTALHKSIALPQNIAHKPNSKNGNIASYPLSTGQVRRYIVVPHPQNGSNTTSTVLVLVSMILLSSSIGFWVG